jgi:hypothetical protein
MSFFFLRVLRTPVTSHSRGGITGTLISGGFGGFGLILGFGFGFGATFGLDIRTRLTL